MDGKAHRDWYRRFFEGVALDFWAACIPAAITRSEAGFVAKKLRLGARARLLDVPCGLGRHSNELAAMGHDVTGVDLSADAIARATEIAAASGSPPRFVVSDMRSLAWRAEFDGACCLGNSLGYIEPKETGGFLRAIASTLKPGARFVVDTGMAAESILPRLRPNEWAQVDDITFLERNTYHPGDGCIETEYTFLRGGERTVRTGLQWVFTLREIRAMFDEAGLDVEETLGSIAGEPFAIGSPLLVLVARKR
ncbi:MAG TPA: methyltransferase domain-containing protein [Verrucomicrobiae bacterium]|nr:methyltransferase domain-containing protein [Verrucomicrobiae bacterium]